MDQPDRDPGRRSLPHHPPHDVVNQSIITYVTVTVEKRRPILHRADAVEVILNAWKGADRWSVGRYVIMPDHLHFFCAPATMPSTPLKPWMQFWRSTATRNWPHAHPKTIWQKDFLIANSAPARAIAKSGSTSGRIQSSQGFVRGPKIGPIKAS